MKAPLLFLFILINYASLMAQDSTFVTIKTGSRIRDVLAMTDIFSHAQFVSGTVFYRNGAAAKGRMNYNSLSDQMLFIDPKGDTLALNNEKTIDFIALDKDTFYYVDGYVRLVSGNSVVKLAEKKVWQVADVRKIGSHNRPAVGYAVTSFSTITDGFGRTYDLIMDEDVVLRRKPQYYFGDIYNSFAPANKKNLLSFFSKKESMLAVYLKENKVNFNKKPDLEKLARFIEQNY
jgi:hypothetical protein